MEADMYAATPAEALQVAATHDEIPRCERRTINKRKKRRRTRAVPTLSTAAKTPVVAV
jgi:hypothetical protein